jgi:hypothetical protein
MKPTPLSKLLRTALLLLSTALPAAAFVPAAAAQATAETAEASALRIEQKLLPIDLADFRQARGRERTARENVRLAGERVDQLLAGDELSLGELESRRDELATAEATAQAAGARVGQLLARLEERLRRISFLEGETGVARRPAPDPIAGRWQMQVLPQGPSAILILAREGTIITGRMETAAGSAGIRGTFSSNGLRFERLDARGGAESTYLGTLDPVNGRIQGEWQGSELAAGKPATGSWSAERIQETSTGARP